MSLVYHVFQEDHQLDPSLFREVIHRIIHYSRRTVLKILFKLGNVQQELMFFSSSDSDELESSMCICEDLADFGLLVASSSDDHSSQNLSFYSTDMTVILNSTSKSSSNSQLGTKPLSLSRLSSTPAFGEIGYFRTLSRGNLSSVISSQSNPKKFLIVETTLQLYALTSSPYLCT